MTLQGGDLRRKSAQAEALAVEIQEIIAQVDELGRVFNRVRTAIDDAIGGTATGKDRQMLGAISHAESNSRKASVAGNSASNAAKSLARDLEAKAKEAERQEEASRRSSKRKESR